MSRHLLLDRPDRQIVLGYDHMLRSFFGQVFVPNHPRRAGIAVDGWPTTSGLGGRRPVVSSAQMANDLAELGEWAKTRIPDEFGTEPMAAYHLGLLLGLLSNECDCGEDLPEVPLPDCLKGARS